MLRQRLFFGALMTLVFSALAILDGWLDGSLTGAYSDDRQIQGTIVAILVASLMIPANLELAGLAAAKQLKIFAPVSIASCMIIVTGWYWSQFIPPSICYSLPAILALMPVVLLLYQYLTLGTSSVLANCGATAFSVLYLAGLGAFVIAIRIDFGIWAMLMFVFVIKCSDIGAYAGGTLFGRHKFSPHISPGKTWEGMAAAIGTAVVVAMAFAALSGIMACWLAALFGICFAFIGQMGDLAESMIKRDAKKKDSDDKVPGFGGVLDIIDSPLLAAPFAYVFFALAAGTKA